MSDVIRLGRMEIRLLFFDSMGAKCSSVLVRTPDVSILVDPGAAGLPGGFPCPKELKEELCEEAFRRIRRYGQGADVVVITHYHYDHHPSPDRREEMRKVLSGKRLLVKDPNQWINQSQRERAQDFLSWFFQLEGGGDFEDILQPPRPRLEDPFETHPRTAAQWERARGKKRMVYGAKKRWFGSIVRTWSKGEWIGEFGNVRFADGKSFTFGRTRVKFTKPLFHGQFLENLGWVVGFKVEYRGQKFLYTSDLQGPVIEEYADWITRERPAVLVADGPPVYGYGYMTGEEDVQQVLENMRRIIDSKPKLIIWDHHLCRGEFRRRLEKVFAYAEKVRVPLLTAAEKLGDKPLIEKCMV